MTAIRIGLLGCGAVAELYYAPALRALEGAGRVEVAALTDVDPRRRIKLARYFPNARQLEALPAREEVDLAVVATPARWHAEHAITLLERRIGVLCEKPLAASVADAERMIAAAASQRATLAVALIRRFLPAHRTLSRLVQDDTFCALRQIAIQEGGPFNWPAATPSFFDQRQAGGGVLLDVGVHVLDLLTWWLGDPVELDYADDAEGGLEATCRIRLAFARKGARVPASVLLSRDWKTSNTWTLEFERATVLWHVGQADRIEIRPAGSSTWLVARIEYLDTAGRHPSDSFSQAFTRQVLDAVEAVASSRLPTVTGEEALRSLRLIERCYAARRPLGWEVIP